jgi:hypothetical protein
MANRAQSNSGRGRRQQEATSPGKGLSTKKVDRYLRLVIFLAIIGLVYIANAHYAERQVQKREALKKEVKRLKDRYYMKEADLDAGVRYSELVKMTDSLGLKKLTEPPFRLIPPSKEAD